MMEAKGGLVPENVADTIASRALPTLQEFLDADQTKEGLLAMKGSSKRLVFDLLQEVPQTTLLDSQQSWKRSRQPHTLLMPLTY